MMKLKVFALYDNVAKIFLSPTFEASEQVAIRNLDNFINTSKNAVIHNHPNDFAFFCLGSWDADTGILSLPDSGVPEPIYTTLAPLIKE